MLDLDAFDPRTWHRDGVVTRVRATKSRTERIPSNLFKAALGAAAATSFVLGALWSSDVRIWRQATEPPVVSSSADGGDVAPAYWAHLGRVMGRLSPLAEDSDLDLEPLL